MEDSHISINFVKGGPETSATYIQTWCLILEVGTILLDLEGLVPEQHHYIQLLEEVH